MTLHELTILLRQEAGDPRIHLEEVLGRMLLLDATAGELILSGAIGSTRSELASLSIPRETCDALLEQIRHAASVRELRAAETRGWREVVGEAVFTANSLVRKGEAVMCTVSGRVEPAAWAGQIIGIALTDAEPHELVTVRLTR